MKKILDRFKKTAKTGKKDKLANKVKKKTEKGEDKTKEADLDELSLKDAFDRFDVNKDGFIDKDELSTLLIEFLELKNPPTEVQIGRIMKKVDIDQNGKIDFEEFKLMMHGRQDTKNQYLTTFRNFDTNGDGYITADELGECMKKVHPDTTDEEIEVIMDTLDSSK